MLQDVVHCAGTVKSGPAVGPAAMPESAGLTERRQRDMFDTNAHGSSQPDQSPTQVLDAASLAQLDSLDPTGSGAFLCRVLSTYQRSLARQLPLVEEAWAARTLDDLSRAAHTLKSASASVGALNLSRLCDALETAVRLGQREALPQTVEAFRQEVARVELAVAAELKTRATG